MTLVGDVGEMPRTSEKVGEALMAHFPLVANEVWRLPYLRYIAIFATDNISIHDAIRK